MYGKFFQLFKRKLKTGRLEMRILEPTTENAKLVWDALKNENPNDKAANYEVKLGT